MNNMNKLKKATADGDLDAFAELIGDRTAKEAALLEQECTEGDFAHLLWAVSATWGFEVLWAGEYLLPPEERHSGVDLPPADSLDWESPLKGLGLWAPQDQMARLGAIA